MDMGRGYGVGEGGRTPTVGVLDIPPGGQVRRSAIPARAVTLAGTSYEPMVFLKSARVSISFSYCFTKSSIFWGVMSDPN